MFGSGFASAKKIFDFLTPQDYAQAIWEKKNFFGLEPIAEPDPPWYTLTPQDHAQAMGYRFEKKKFFGPEFPWIWPIIDLEGRAYWQVQLCKNIEFFSKFFSSSKVL